ncbi:acyltransferase domain-containing protein [Saccharothrix yanglingensis]|uniref:acyltransferase domain-containing protein n=1 Tax=Saccharothrix yanglingensis TaxID=659496 RepID=UPI0027D34780|nr:acyltransferase domain-containing protein [Saccharothrix yanglingensis]
MAPRPSRPPPRRQIPSPVRARTPFCSTVTGDPLADTTVPGADHWYRNLRRTARFEQATRALRADGHGTCVEASPHPILAPAIANTPREEDPAVIATLRRHDGGRRRFLTAVAKAHAHGVPVEWGASFDGHVPDLADHPT